MQTLNILGCGKLGQTLAHLWHHRQQFQIGQVLNQSLQSARNACAFIGAGEAIEHWHQLKPANIWLIGANDSNITAIAKTLATADVIDAETVVFHCSGALSSDALAPLANLTSKLASIHPIHSFASAESSIEQFAGSYCACEGDADAVSILHQRFSAIGAQLLDIDSHNKSLYHAASVIACNYLVSLMDASLECFDAAGISPNDASKLLLPLVSQTLNNCLTNSPQQALTGPIARGDHQTVEKQLSALNNLNGDLATLYRDLGLRALKLAEPQLRENDRSALNALLNPL